MKIKSFIEDLMTGTYTPPGICFMAEEGEGGGSGSEAADAGAGGSEEGGEGQAAAADAMGDPNAGLMADAGQQEEGEGDSGKTLTFTDDKGKATELPVPDKFIKDGEINHAAILKAATDAGKDVRRLQNELAEAKKAGPIEGSGDAPDEAGGYLAGQEYLTEGEDGKFSIVLPDGKGAVAPVPVDDPALVAFAEAAHELKLSPQQFDGIVKRVLKAADDNLPVIDYDAEAQKLGPNAKAITSANKTWADGMHEAGVLSDAERARMNVMGADAVGQSLLNKLRQQGGGKPIPTNLGGIDGEGMSKEEWYAAKPDHRTDPVAYKKWQQQGEEIFGTAPSGSSEAGLGAPQNQGGHRSAYQKT